MADVLQLQLGVRHLVPTEDRLLIRRLPREVESITGSGIIVTAGLFMNDKGEIDKEVQGTSDEENTCYAEVLAIGSAVKDVTLQHKVMITKYAGIEVMKGTGIYMIKEGDVIALVA